MFLCFCFFSSEGGGFAPLFRTTFFWDPPPLHQKKTRETGNRSPRENSTPQLWSSLSSTGASWKTSGLREVVGVLRSCVRQGTSPRRRRQRLERASERAQREKGGQQSAGNEGMTEMTPINPSPMIPLNHPYKQSPGSFPHSWSTILKLISHSFPPSFFSKTGRFPWVLMVALD